MHIWANRICSPKVCCINHEKAHHERHKHDNENVAHDANDDDEDVADEAAATSAKKTWLTFGCAPHYEVHRGVLPLHI